MAGGYGVRTLQNIQSWSRWFALQNLERLRLNPLSRSQQRRMLRRVRATRAVSMLRNFQPQRIRAQVCDLAEEFHGRLGVSVFQFSVCRAHAAQGLNLAAVAD